MLFHLSFFVIYPSISLREKKLNEQRTVTRRPIIPNNTADSFERLPRGINGIQYSKG